MDIIINWSMKWRNCLIEGNLNEIESEYDCWCDCDNDCFWHFCDTNININIDVDVNHVSFEQFITFLETNPFSS